MSLIRCTVEGDAENARRPSPCGRFFIQGTDMYNNAHESRTDRRGGIIAFLADAELLATTDAMAAEEGISPL